jgi:DnaK suppressor protein
MKVRIKPEARSGESRSHGFGLSPEGGEPSDRSRALREILEERSQRIRAELKTLSRRFREEERPEVWDEGDRAAYGFGRELGSARVDQLTRMLRQIEDALARHAEGRYGYCARCEGEIPVARLRSLPFTVYCRDCQQIREDEDRRAQREQARLVA